MQELNMRGFLYRREIVFFCKVALRLFQDEVIKNFLKFKSRVDIEKCGEPSFLVVLTVANYSYKRDDGVYVVSIGSLKN